MKKINEILDRIFKFMYFKVFNLGFIGKSYIMFLLK